MNKISAIALSIFIALTACEEIAVQQTEPARKDSTEIKSQDYLIHSTLYAQSAAEYKALCYQAYELAGIQLERALAKGVKKPTVILDLDETVLDNSPYTAWQIVTNNPYSPDTWAKWVEDASAEAVPGSIEFLTWAHSHGVELYYISNRSTDGLKATIKNLQSLGVPQADSSHIFLKTNTSDKSERRAKVKAGSADIILYIGDNLGDYSEVWDKPANVKERLNNVQVHRDEMGVNFIVLPNSLYGTWEGAVYNYDRSFNNTERDSLRRIYLDPWGADAL
ncbi:5'-nucleotidase, lipoprotein e(P4) family [Cryomorphaceae bacterium 1068]|nr:5'-nucleotidase, lipoprotein e(P4) family [Cryomorphaceae bacterium 1068]